MFRQHPKDFQLYQQPQHQAMNDHNAARIESEPPLSNRQKAMNELIDYLCFAYFGALWQDNNDNARENSAFLDSNYGRFFRVLEDFEANNHLEDVCFLNS